MWVGHILCSHISGPKYYYYAYIYSIIIYLYELICPENLIIFMS